MWILWVTISAVFMVGLVFIVYLSRMKKRNEHVYSTFDELYAAASGGDAEAQNQLGNYYRDQGEEFPNCKQSAILWYERAAAQKHAIAATSLGMMAMMDAIMENNEDISEAITWLEKGATFGEVAAQHMLAVLYAEADAPHCNPERAEYWLLTAAANGHKRALEIATSTKEGRESFKEFKKRST